MDEKKYKQSIDDYIGKEKLFNNELKGRIVNGISERKRKKGMIQMVKKLTPIMVLLLLVGGGTIFYLISTKPENQMLSQGEENVVTPVTGAEENRNLNEAQHEQLRETLNLSLRVIRAMINKDYEYLEGIIDPTVKLNRENNTITYGDGSYEIPLMDEFDYNHFEFRAYIVEEDKILIILGVNNVSYEFSFVEDQENSGNYLLKSLITN